MVSVYPFVPEIKGQTTTHWPTENRQKDKQKPEIKGQITTHWSTENRQKDKQKPPLISGF
jgi:hypothetical protein